MSDNNIQLAVGIDATPIVSQLQAARAEADKLRTEMVNAVKSIKEGFDKSGAAVQSMGNELKNALGRIEAQQKVIQKLNSDLETYAKNNKNAFDETVLKKYTDQIKKLETELANIKTQGSQAAKGVADVNTQVDNTGSAAGKAGGLIKGMFTGFSLASFATTAINFIVSSFSKLISELLDTDKAARESALALDNFGQVADRIKSDVDGLADSLAYMNKIGKINIDVAFGKGSKSQLVDLGAQNIGLSQLLLDLAEKEKEATDNLNKTREYAFKKISDEDYQNLSKLNFNEEAAAEFISDSGKRLLSAVKKSADALMSVQTEINKRRQEQGVVSAQIRLTKNDLAKQEIEDAEAAAKKLAAASKKSKAERDRKEREDEAYLKRLADLEKQLADAKLGALDEGRQKDIAVEDGRYNAAIKSLELLRDKSKATAEEKKLINKIIEQQQTLHAKKLLDIDAKYYKEAYTAFQSAQESINGVLLEGEAKELSDIEKKYDRILKAIEEAKKKVIAASSDPIVQLGVSVIAAGQTKSVTEAREKEELDITKKYALKKIDEEQALSLALNDVLLKSGVSQVALEKLKEVNKLNIVIEFAQRKLDLLKASGDEENALQIAQLTKVIQEAQGKLKGMKGKGDSLFDFLGLSSEEAEKVIAITAAVSRLGEVAGDFVAGFVAGVDRQIEAKQRLLDAIDEQLNKQQEAVDKERELEEKGFANNLGMAEKRLAELQRQKDAELEQERKLQRERAALQKAQIIADSIAQGSNLVTASTDIFKLSTKAFGPAGVPIAIVAIGAMLAGFIASKVAALKAAGEVPKFSKGDRFDIYNALEGAPSHAEGGAGLYDEKSGRKIAEFEGKEKLFIVNKGSSKKYEPLLDAINKDELSRWSYADLKRFIQPTGISFDKEKVSHLLPQSNQVTVINAGSNGTSKTEELLERVAISNEKLLEAELNKEEVTELPDKTIIKNGYRTRVIHKK